MLSAGVPLVGAQKSRLHLRHREDRVYDAGGSGAKAGQDVEDGRRGG